MSILCSLSRQVANYDTVRRGSLYKRLVIPLSAFVLLASLGLAIWISSLQRRESLRRFERTAINNAGFMGQVPLPRSTEMANRLSTILEVRVAFLSGDGQITHSSGDRWPTEIEKQLKAFSGDSTTATRIGNYDLAITPLESSQDHLILVRDREEGLTGIGVWILIPTLFMTAAFGGLVFLLADRIVRPLTLLTRWLPNLKTNEEPENPIPGSLTARSDELGQLARSLKDTHQSLLREQKLRHQSERLATLGRIATSLAHEIRNPAAAIRMHADLIEPRVEAEGSESINLIREEVERITDLVNQWLFVARAQPPERRPHDLVEMLEDVGRRQKPALTHAATHLEINAPQPALVDCDKLRIEQVLRNLIVNASQAMPAGGPIIAGLKLAAGEARLTIQDSGSGFSSEALARFGEPFFSEREGGMGIGLTLAREVIQAHDGAIEASNHPGGGALVSVTLPLST